MSTTRFIYKSENISTKAVLLSHHISPKNCTWIKLVLCQKSLPAKSFLLPLRKIFLSIPSWHYPFLIIYLNNHFFKRWSVISEAILTKSYQDNCPNVSWMRILPMDMSKKSGKVHKTSILHNFKQLMKAGSSSLPQERTHQFVVHCQTSTIVIMLT